MNKSITQKLSVTEEETDGKYTKNFPRTPKYTGWCSWGKNQWKTDSRSRWFLSIAIQIHTSKQKRNWTNEHTLSQFSLASKDSRRKCNIRQTTVQSLIYRVDQYYPTDTYISALKLIKVQHNLWGNPVEL